MALEIERKFLVIKDGWRESARPGLQIVDYLIANFDGGKMRILFCDDLPTMTLKGPRRGLTRSEYHMPLPEADARAIVDEFSSGPGLEKCRYQADMAGLTWQIDEYAGIFEGLVTADVELPFESFTLTLPDWAGREITHDPRFGSGRLAAAVADGRPMNLESLDYG
ncbi:adenylate cyclase [Phyllobacterium bourgognense]|uniref:CYTH domain-containing protein n=1 Tax=Phyllobacterium bourgognense TaxID=314236 RepID=A0A368YLW8_9HYPH|nr:adenylate cyclase [Phyllobacterium bourgognense]RCW81220.1 CYTH domain-containing protein [Phyllobacterium bourgognense]